MVSRIIKSAAALAATLSLASAASANCGSGIYCGQSAYAAPTQSYAAPAYRTLSSHQADRTYGTGSISETYSASNTYSFSGSTASVQGLGRNESLQATNCPVNVHGSGEGQVLSCYNVVKPVARTTYYRVVRPVIYVRYPVPVAVPYTSPCNVVTHYSRYGQQQTPKVRRGCRR